MDNLSVYRGNSKTITVTIPDSLTGTTGTTILTVNTRRSSTYSGTTLLANEGVKVGAIVTFNITAEQNTIPEYVYFYNINVYEGDEKYTIAEGSYAVKSSLIE